MPASSDRGSRPSCGPETCIAAYSTGALTLPNPGSTLLVRLPNPLGDVVMATPLLRALRRQLPQARILACGDASFGPLLDGLDSYDAFLPLDAAARRGRGAWRRQAALLRTARADVALLLPNSWSTAAAAWRARIPLRVGRRAQGRGLLLHHRLPPIPGPAPMTELYADFLTPLGLQREVPHAELVAGVPRTRLPDAPLLGVAPGAAFGPSKQLPDATLITALDLLHAEHGLVPVLLGAPREQRWLAELAARMQAPVVLVDPGSGGLDEAKALLARCDALLAMDNGARHMAAALGVPQLAVYGPTHPAWSAHALEHTRLLRREELDCLACHHKRCPLPDHPCMRRITPRDLVDGLLAATRPAAGATPPQKKSGDR